MGWGVGFTPVIHQKDTFLMGGQPDPHQITFELSVSCWYTFDMSFNSVLLATLWKSAGL